MNKYLKNNLLLITTILLLISFSFSVSADLTDNNSVYYSMDSVDVVGSVIVDSSVNGNDATNSGTTNTSGILNEARSFDGSNDYINADIILPFSSNYTINGWFYHSSTNPSARESLISNIKSDNTKYRFQLRFTSDSTGHIQLVSSDPFVTDDTTTDYADGEWHMFTLTVSGNSANVYFDGSSTPELSITLNEEDEDIFRIGSAFNQYFYNGKIDEVMISSRVFSSTEISTLYNNGTGYNPYSETPIIEGEHYESTFISSQNNNINLRLNNVNYTILTESYEDNETHPFYSDVTIQMFSPTNSEVTCYILGNDTIIAESKRTNLAGTIGSMSMSTLLGNTTIGNNKLELKCNKVSTRNTVIGLTKGINHVANYNITYYLETISEDNISLNNESLKTENITAPYNGTVIIEWDNQITNNNGSTQNTITQLITSKGSCGIFNRTINNGFTGSTGGGCAFPITKDELFTVGLYVTADNINITHKPKLKFVNSPVNYTTIKVNNVSTTPKLLENIIIENDGTFNNLYLKTGISIKDSGQTFNLFYNVNGVNTTTIPKTASSNNEVLISQDLINVESGTLNISLYGYSNTGTIFINGGDFLSYLTKDYPTNGSFFEVRVNNSYNGTSLNNFTVEVDGLNITTSDGVAEIFTFEPIVNLTIYSEEYFSNTILNYNTSNNLNTSLNQSLVTLIGYEIISNNKVLNYSASENPYFNLSTTNGNITVPFSAGEHNITLINNIGYYNFTQTINISPLQTTPINLSFFNSNTTINVKSFFGNEDIQNYSLFIRSNNYTYEENFINQNTSTILNLIPGSYYYNISSPEYANQNGTINIILGNDEQTIKLYTTNSILFNVYRITDNTLIDNSTTTISLTGPTSKSNTTNNGTLYFDYLIDGTYKAIISNPNFDNSEIYLTVLNKTFQNVNIYLGTGKTNKIFTTINTAGDIISDVLITFSQKINNSYVTVEQGITDFSGTLAINLNINTTYLFTATNPSYKTFTGEIKPFQDSYTITLEENSTLDYVTVFDTVSYSTFIERDVGSSNATVNFIIASISTAGNLEYYGMNTSYNGVNYFINTTTSPGGGREIFNITGINIDVQNLINVTYFFKAVGYETQTWTTPFRFSDLEGNNTSLVGGLCTNLPESTDGKAILGTVILIMAILGVGITFRNISVGSIIGLVFIFVFSRTSCPLFPLPYTIISMAVLTIVIIGDQIFRS